MPSLNSLMGIGPFKYLGHPNTHVVHGGGGSSTPGVTKIDSIPDWYRPYIQAVAGSAVDAYQNSQLGQVAPLQQTQKDAADALVTAANQSADNYNIAAAAQDQIGEVAQYGELGSVPALSDRTQGIKAAALYDADKAYSGLNQGINNANAIGGARAGLLKADHQRGVARQFADFDYNDLVNRQNNALTASQNSINNTNSLNQLAGAPAQYIGQAGTALQQQRQAQLDSTYSALQQAGSLLSGAPTPSQSAIAKGGK